MNGEHTYCTFRLDRHLYGVPILDVKEVTRETSITPIYHAPEEVAGYVNIRGHVFLALDLRRLLGLAPVALTGDSRLILFKSTVASALGVVVDEICDIQAVGHDQIESFGSDPPEAAIRKRGLQRAELIAQLCRLPEEILVVLEPRRFLEIVEQSV